MGSFPQASPLHTGIKMGWSAPPAAPRCPACNKSVFATEAYMAADRTPFHTRCLKCSQCPKKLTPATLNEHEKQLYCKHCYELKFAPMEDDIPDKMVMRVLPIQGTFIVEPKPVIPSHLSAEELQKLKDAEYAARAWSEAMGSNGSKLGAGVRGWKPVQSPQKTLIPSERISLFVFFSVYLYFYTILPRRQTHPHSYTHHQFIISTITNNSAVSKFAVFVSKYIFS